MDVVHTNLTALGGVVDVESTPGRGTTISMTLPITLAIIQSLIVVVGAPALRDPAQRGARDAADRRLARSSAARAASCSICAARRCRCAGSPPNSTWPRPRRTAKPYVVVIGLGEARMGLLVDRLDGQQDTVIKPIQGPIPAVRGIAGATELGDQEPVLVLDVSALLADLGRRREAL